MRLINQARRGPVSIALVTLAQLTDVDAVFVTNAAVGIRPVAPSTCLSRLALWPGWGGEVLPAHESEGGQALGQVEPL